jgi:hypothetical protein
MKFILFILISLQSYTYGSDLTVWRQAATLDLSQKISTLGPDNPLSSCSCSLVPAITLKKAGDELSKLIEPLLDSATPELVYAGVGAGSAGPDVFFLEQIFHELNQLSFKENQNQIKISVILIDFCYGPEAQYIRYEDFFQQAPKTYSYTEDLFPYVMNFLSQKGLTVLSKSQIFKIDVELRTYSRMEDYLSDIAKKNAPKPSILAAIDTRAVDLQSLEDQLQKPGIVIQLEGLTNKNSKDEFWDFNRMPEDGARYQRIQLILE